MKFPLDIYPGRFPELPDDTQPEQSAVPLDLQAEPDPHPAPTPQQTEGLVSVDEFGKPAKELAAIVPPTFGGRDKGATSRSATTAETRAVEPAATDIETKPVSEAATLPGKVSAAAGAVVTDKTVEQPANLTPGATSSRSTEQKHEPKPTEAPSAAKGDKPWWRRASGAKKLPDQSETRSSEQPEEAADSAPSEPGLTDGGANEPPKPPEKGDAAPDDDGEQRRLAGAMKEFTGLVSPLKGGVEAQVWLMRASKADIELQVHLVDAVKALEGEGAKSSMLERSDPKAIKDHANALAEKVTQDGLSPGKAAAACAAASIYTNDAYQRTADRKPLRADQAEANAVFFMNEFAMTLAWHMPRAEVLTGPHPPTLHAAASERIDDFATETDDLVWLKDKVGRFCGELYMRALEERRINAEPLAETDNPEALRRNNDELAQKIDANRQCGVKPALHERNGTGEKWALHDIHSIWNRYTELALRRGERPAPSEWIQNTRVMAIHYQAEEVDPMAAIQFEPTSRASQDLLSDSTAHRIVYMDRKGELYADETCATPLRKIYENYGKTVNYEALRQYLLITYFDLTMPIGVVREAQAATATAQQSRGEDARRPKVWHDLLLPRMRIMNKYKRAELKAMQKADEAAESTVATKEDKENNVIWYTRRIAPNYRAGKEARKNAAKRGITLPEFGLTFVDEYYHPRAGKAGTHHAKRRGGKDGRGKGEARS